MIAAPTCSEEARIDAQTWLDALETDEEAAGAKYCACPACAAVEAILEKRDQIL